MFGFSHLTRRDTAGPAQQAVAAALNLDRPARGRHCAHRGPSHLERWAPSIMVDQKGSRR